MKTIKYLTMAAVAVSLAACSSDDESTSAGTSDSAVALKVTAGIDVQSRAYNTTWEDGDEIGIYAFDSDTSDETDTNVEYKTSSGSLGSFSAVGTPIYLSADGTKRDLIAYYPYSSSVSNGVYTIDVSDQTSQSAIDLLGADMVSGIERTAPEVAFTFEHKLVKVEMEIAAGDGIETSDLAGLAISLSGQYTAGTYDIAAAGDVVATGSTSDITFLTAADGQSSEAIIMPSSSVTGMVMTFTLGNDTYTWNVGSGATTSFEAGKKYVYTITVKKTGIVVTSVITAWADGVTDTGTAE